MVAVKLCLVVLGCGEIMPGRGWWQKNYGFVGWSWMVVEGCTI